MTTLMMKFVRPKVSIVSLTALWSNIFMNRSKMTRIGVVGLTFLVYGRWLTTLASYTLNIDHHIVSEQ